MALKRALTGVGLLVLACCFWLAVTGGSRAAGAETPGSIDPSFGGGGLVLQPLPPYPAEGPDGEDMAVGPQDEIFVLQGLRNCQATTCEIEFFIQRYLPEGVLDRSFGSEGSSEKVLVSAPIGSNAPSRKTFGSLAVGPSGEPVLAAADRGDVTLFSFDRSGRLASNFGDGGAVSIDFGGWESRPQLALLPDERIVLAAGSIQGPGRSFVALARLQPNGELDPSFGAGLPATREPGWMVVRGVPGALSVWRSGAIALAGPGCCATKMQRSIYTTRRQSDGALLPAGRSRPWRYLRVGAHARVSSMVTLPRGRLYLVGGSKSGMFAARLLPSGRLDKTYGRSGIARLPEMDGGLSPAVADAAHRLYVTGSHYSEEEYAPSQGRLARLTPRGRHDRTWGRNHRGFIPLPEMSEPLALAFQSNGRLVVFGENAGECIRSCRRPSSTLTRVFAGSLRRRR